MACRWISWLRFTGVVSLMLAVAQPAWAQTFSSGSTGALGAFNPTANTTVTLPPDGVLNYTTVTIPTGVTVTFAKNAANTPVTMLATGGVTIAGTIRLNGADGVTGVIVPTIGGVGGPGGFDGGNGGSASQSQFAGSGLGPGGGLTTANTAGVGSTGLGGAYGAQSSFVSLVPLFGGSGGAGGNGEGPFGSATVSGSSGGGGGGAIVIASSSSITVNATGRIETNGGDGTQTSLGGCRVNASGAGSGGAIRLVAPQITTATGSVISAAGLGGGCGFPTGTVSGPGRIRLEAFTFLVAGTVTPPALTGTPGPVTAVSNPALVNFPAITFTVGGIAPPNPGGRYDAVDISLPQGTTNPVSVVVTTQNIPPNTLVRLFLRPRGGAQVAMTGTTTGTTALATASFSVTFPLGQASVLNVLTDFTLPQVASLFPLIDGEEVDRVMVAAAYGGPSTVTLITKSRREVRADQLPLETQLKLSATLAAEPSER